MRIVTPQEFDKIHRGLKSEGFCLLVETAIESGMRWGELTELRLKDFNLTTRIVTVSRTVVEVNPTYHPEGGRFLIKEYPKDKEYRRFKLSAQIIAKLADYVIDNSGDREATAAEVRRVFAALMADLQARAAV